MQVQVQEQVMDAVKTDAFAERMLAGLNHGALMLMTSIGHRTRLFDRMAELPPSTSHEIAAEAELDERYVREWLAAMFTGGVVEHDPETERFALPAEHAAVLTRAAAPDNMAAFAQWIGVLASVEDGIVDCFREGGGLPYSAFGRMHDVMAEDSGQTVVAALEEHILPLVPGLRRELENGIDVLDVGCGSGRAMNLLARLFPKSRFTGVDFSEEAVAAGRAEADLHGTANIRFDIRDAARLAEVGQYDLITAFDAIHDQADPAAVLASIRSALRPDGTFLMQDIRASSHVHENCDHPIGPFLYTISTMHCMSVSLAHGGAGLGAMWGEHKAREMLGEAGFTQVSVRGRAHDVQNSYYVVRKD